jgi:murein L,D-transpeptidase YafK
LRVERRTLCLLGIVLFGLGATGAADPLAAERTAPTAGAEAVGQGYGKLGTAHLPYGKLGTADRAVLPPEPPAALMAEDALARRLASHGMQLGGPIMVRIFKSEAELEVWMQAGDRFELLATYAICNWSGTLGPKLREGDKQSPEGLYSIGRRQLHRSRRWRRSLDIGYPNAFDRVHTRTGSSILVHGGCTTTGCFAMTDQVMEEIFQLSRAALLQGQQRIAVHIFPFRMTPENMAAHADSPWHSFWDNLKEAYDLFERTRLPPTVKVCDRRYVVSVAGDESGCPEGTVAAVVKPPVTAAAKRRRVGVKAARLRPRPSALQAYAAARQARLAARGGSGASYLGRGVPPREVKAVGYRKLRR